MISIIASSASGLSPLTRGTRFSPRVQIFDWRFIPAGAGNTVNNPRRTSPTTVYPRWRGEHQVRKGEHGTTAGLSPLARGTRVAILLAFPQHRFIPAGAGNTGDPQSIQAAAAVYPRWRGEHSHRVNPAEKQHGLSPLARGTPDNLRLQSVDLRFIPAGAGNTGQFPEKCHTVPVYPRWRGEHPLRIRPP